MSVLRIPKSGTMITGVVILLPDNFDPAKEYQGILFGHGIGQRGDGSGTNVEGWMISPKEAYKIPELIAASDRILIAPELYFNENWSDKYFDFAYSYLRSNYKVGAKVFLDGVSLGGQAIWSWGSNHPELVLGIHATAAVTVNVDFCKIKCPVLAHHAYNDDTVPFSEGMIALNKINACSPKLAGMIPFGNGHAIWRSDAFGKSVYEQPELKAFFGIGTPNVPINPPVPTGFKADASATQTNVILGSVAILDASRSTGYKVTPGGYEDLVWNLMSHPEGKDAWNVFPNFNKTGKTIALQNLIPGEYVFELIAKDVNGNMLKDTVKITVSPAPTGKKIVGEVVINGKPANCFDDNTWAYK